MSSDVAVLDEAGSSYDTGYERRNLEIMDDIQYDFDYWVRQQELRDEQEMLADIDRVTGLMSDPRFRDDDELDLIWNYRYSDTDDEVETVLIKSAPRRGRPSKRQLHPVNHRCFFLRYHRDEVQWQNERLQMKRRHDDAMDLEQQLLPDEQPVKSAQASLPKDIAIDVNDPTRCVSVNFLSGGRVVYTYTSHQLAPLFRRDVRFRAPRHAYNYHPATPTSVRRPGR
jgi:hypothetical protein